MKNLDQILQLLTCVDDGFYGRVVIRIREGKAVMITEERDTRLDDDTEPRDRNAHTK
jgi:hypothetical protein